MLRYICCLRERPQWDGRLKIHVFMQCMAWTTVRGALSVVEFDAFAARELGVGTEEDVCLADMISTC